MDNGNHIRNIIWKAVRSKVPTGMIFPWWALVVRAVLFPLNSFYWHMNKKTGYQWEDDTWLINGVIYSNEFLNVLEKAHGETYRLTRTGDTVKIEVMNGARITGGGTN